MRSTPRTKLARCRARVSSSSSSVGPSSRKRANSSSSTRSNSLKSTPGRAVATTLKSPAISPAWLYAKTLVASSSLVDEAAVEARVTACAQHRCRDIEEVGIGRAPLGCHPRLVDARLRHAVFEYLALFACPLRNPTLKLRDGRPRRDKIGRASCRETAESKDAATQATHHT